ncbi:MAG: hypothetical protein LBV69_00405 [Bacteroidales bacterium]|jgi:hypothetical protein|nr:hypothetical protein [Bacteroidales bacterium]
MKIKDIYNPDNEDIFNWVNDESEKWPASDWDYYVISRGTNDELILSYANNYNCSKRAFFIHCLYYLVGEYFNVKLLFDEEKAQSSKRKIIQNKERIEKLLGLVAQSSSKEVQEWKENAISLLLGNLNFNSDFWFNRMFWEDIKDLQSKTNTTKIG